MIESIESNASVIVVLCVTYVILFITRKYPPSVGGMERLSYCLTAEIAHRRAARIISWGGSQRLLPLFFTLALVRAIAILLRGHVGVIHIGDPVLAPLGFILKMIFRVPVVVTVHGLDIIYPNRLYQLLIPRLLARFDAIIAISRHSREECLARGLSAQRCRMVPVGIETDVPIVLSSEAARLQIERQFGLNLHDLKVILTTGRLVARKGVARFVDETLPAILARRSDVRYLIIGEGPERSRIHLAIERRGVRDQAILLGKVDRTTLWAAYQACDLFVMPNVPRAGDVEGFGIVALEACVAGRCVVASDIDGIRDAILDGRNGVLVPADDPSSQAAVIVDLLDNDEKREAIGQHAREFVVERFSWPRIADQYLRIFDEVCRGKAEKLGLGLQQE